MLMDSNADCTVHALYVWTCCLVHAAECIILVPLQIWADACAAHTGLDAVGEVRLMPAGDPIRLPWHPQHAICLTDMHDPPGARPSVLMPGRVEPISVEANPDA